MKILCILLLSMFLMQPPHKLQTNKFEIVLPAESSYRIQTVDAGIANLELHLYILEQGSSYYIVSHSFYPTSIDLSNTSNFFKGVVNGMVANYQGNLIFEKPLNVGGAIGKKVRVQLPDGDVVEVNYYLKGRTLYQVLIKSSLQEIQSNQVQDCFSSFVLY